MRRLSADDVYALALPEQPAISPDGSRVAYVLRTADRPSDRVERSLWAVGAGGGGSATRLTRGPSDTAPAWSPDGRCLAFLRAKDGVAQIWLLPADTGEAEQLTAMPSGAGAPVWSPDGRRIAFTTRTGVAVGPSDGAACIGGASRPIVVTNRLDYQSDGSGVVAGRPEHVHLHDLSTGETTQLTSGADRSYGRPSWSPDGLRLAFNGPVGDDSDVTGRSAAYVVDLETGPRSLRLVGPDEGRVDAVAWSTDGSGLLVVGRLDTAAGHSQLLQISLTTGVVAVLSSGLDRNVMAGAPGYPGGLPQPVGEAVVFCARDRGCTHVYTADTAGGLPRLLLGGEGRAVSGLSITPRGDVAVVLATPDAFGEIVTTSLQGGPEVVCTDHQRTSLSEVELFRPIRRSFSVSDGLTVEGWLVHDPGAPTPQPLLLDIHGGPHNAWNGAADPVHLYHQELAARGWAVLLLNTRGSDGYGEEFFTATVGAWGRSDAGDFLEPVDQLVAEGIADPDRLAVAGYSYGGYMASYLTSVDGRFAAAVAGAPVIDLISISGTADIGHRIARSELGSSWWASQGLFRELSPIAHASSARTPTLLLQGDADARCPIGQSQQWFAALREQKVPTTLVLYPDASHLFILDGLPSHRADYNARVVDWVERPVSTRAVRRDARPEPGHWQRRLSKVAEEFGVPGAVLGILHVDPAGEDDLVVAAHGVVNTRTGVETTADSLFQIGSITKVWTATLVMQLSEEGKLDLDAPVVSVLPELELADPEVTRGVTMRHLLTHTSGIDGDILTDTGRGDDCVERYVSLLGAAEQVFPLGASFSYCNAGYVIAGRVIERLTGLIWDEALRSRLCNPLGLTQTVTLPEEALLFRCAVGHVSEVGDEPAPAPFSMLPRSVGPAGLIACTAGDLLAFARLHLSGGRGAGGSQVLDESSVAAMREKHADLPDAGFGRDSWGLGWGRFTTDGRTVIGHDGGTVGQSAFLRLVPDQGFAVVLLTNANNGGGGRAGEAADVLLDEALAEFADVRLGTAGEPPMPPVVVDLQPHLGVYERAGMRIEVLDRDGRATLRMTGTDAIAEQLPNRVEEYDLFAVDESHYLAPRGSGTFAPVTFYSLPSGKRFIHIGGRSTPRAA